MAEYIEREAAVMRLMQDGCSAKNIQTIMELPAVDVEKMSDGHHTFADLYEQRLILSAALAKTIRMHGKASGMRTAVSLSVADGSLWALTPTKDVIHTTMS